jgi:hypothetical protein
MKIQNAINKVQKITGANCLKSGQFYYFSFNGHVLSFAQNGTDDSITCIHTKRNNEKDDIMTDYFCGTFHDNITQAVKFIQNR